MLRVLSYFLFGLWYICFHSFFLYYCHPEIGNNFWRFIWRQNFCYQICNFQRYGNIFFFWKRILLNLKLFMLGEELQSMKSNKLWSQKKEKTKTVETARTEPQTNLQRGWPVPEVFWVRLAMSRCWSQRPSVLTSALREGDLAKMCFSFDTSYSSSSTLFNF